MRHGQGLGGEVRWRGEWGRVVPDHSWDGTELVGVLATICGVDSYGDQSHGIGADGADW